MTEYEEDLAGADALRQRIVQLEAQLEALHSSVGAVPTESDDEFLTSLPEAYSDNDPEAPGNKQNDLETQRILEEGSSIWKEAQSDAS